MVEVLFIARLIVLVDDLVKFREFICNGECVGTVIVIHESMFNHKFKNLCNFRETVLNKFRNQEDLKLLRSLVDEFA